MSMTPDQSAKLARADSAPIERALRDEPFFLHGGDLDLTPEDISGIVWDWLGYLACIVVGAGALIALAGYAAGM